MELVPEAITGDEDVPEAITEDEEVSTTVGAVELIVQLVRENSNSIPAMQADCAVALCDLACCSSLRASMVDHGAHHALMAVAGATADEASLSSTAATWLLRRWNATMPSERRTAASIIANVVGAWPDACEDSGVLRPSNCAGWTQIWEERV